MTLTTSSRGLEEWRDFHRKQDCIRACSCLGALSPSCVSSTPQLKREWSPWPEFGWIPGNLCHLSKGYFAMTFLSSSPTCPATQSAFRS
jgi:hypothetical protein